MRDRLTAWLDRSGFFVVLGASLLAVALSALFSGRTSGAAPLPVPAAEQADESLAEAEARAARDAALPVRPGALLRPYADRVPCWFSVSGAYMGHRACDYALPEGGAVCAILPGTVESVQTHPLLGLCVTVRCDEETLIKYAGLSRADAVPGAAVKAGDALGVCGDGVLYERGEAPHVHVELYRGGEPADAETLFSPLAR